LFSSGARYLQEATGRPLPKEGWYRFIVLSVVATFGLSASLEVVSIFLRSKHSFFGAAAGALGILGLLSIKMYQRRVSRLLAGSRGLRGSTLQESAPLPPKVGKFILLLIPRRHREHLIGDLEEEYTAIVPPEYGRQRAQFWHWRQVVMSIAPLLWAQLKRIAGITWLLRRVR